MAPVLTVHVEPTPYVVGFLRSVKRQHQGHVDSFFIATNMSQPWNLNVSGDATLLPDRFVPAAVELARRITRRRYAAVHLAGWGHPLLLWSLLVAGARRVPVIMESDTQLSGGIPRWKRAVKRLFYPRLFRIPEVVMPAGERQAAYFRAYGVPPAKIVKAQMTVDVTEIRRRTSEDDMAARAARREQFGLPAASTVFAFVGRLEDPKKGIRTLLDAFALTSRDCPNATLAIAGDGTARADVEAAAAADPRIRYLGRQDFDGVVALFGCADVAVVPSMFEPFGLVVNEAMACGLPVIASSAVGAVDDLVDDGRTGLLFEPGDSRALAASLVRLAHDDAARRRMGEAARAVIANWTLEEQGRIASDAWAAVLNAHRSGA